MHQEIILSAIALMLAGWLSGFIIYFERKKFASVRMGFYYILGFFIAGVLMLAVASKFAFSSIK